MIDEQRLLCAFIFSAYKSGYCGLMIDASQRERHIQLYRDFIKNGTDFPEHEIQSTQEQMMGHVNSKGVRDYIYRQHYHVVAERIEKEAGVGFDEAIRARSFLYNALRCPVNFYRVLSMNEGSILAKNLFLPDQRNLILLDGLEVPAEGDVVSGHWDYFLEKVPIDLTKHAQEYISRIKLK